MQRMAIAIGIFVVCAALPGCETKSDGAAPAGMIAMFEGACPEGWTRYAPLDGRFARGASQSGAVGGEEEHVHSFDITARTSKDGAHLHMLATADRIEVDSGSYGHIGIYEGYLQAFEEGGRDRKRARRARAVTDTDGAHDHLISVTGDSDAASTLPPYLELVFCMKN